MNAATAGIARTRQILSTVPDPEIPVLSVLDLGIIRSIEETPDGGLRIEVSPTYSGCPATAMIEADIRTALQNAGFPSVQIVEVLSPPWTSEWISAEGHRKLRDYGISPPTAAATPVCPRCGSADTELISEFGSTPCKALHRCHACLEPFDRFKCI